MKDTMVGKIARAFGLLRIATRWRWIWLLPLMAAAEAIGGLSVFALLRVIADPTAAHRLATTRAFPRWMFAGDGHSEVMAFGALLIIVYVARNALLSGNAWARARVVHGSVGELSGRTYAAYLRAPFSISGARNPAAMIQRVRRASEVVPTLVLASVVNLVAEALVVAGLLLLLAVAAPLVTLLAVCGITVLLLVPGLLTSRLFGRWGRQERTLDAHLFKELNEGLGGLKEVKLNERESFFEARFNRVRREFSTIQTKREVLTDALRIGVETAFAVILVFVIVLLTSGGGNGDYIVSILGLYAYAGFRLVPSINRITLNLTSLRSRSRAVVPRSRASGLQSHGSRATVLQDDRVRPCGVRLRSCEPAGRH